MEVYFATVVTYSRLKIIGMKRRKNLQSFFPTTCNSLNFVVQSEKSSRQGIQEVSNIQRSTTHFLHVSGLVPTSCIISRLHGGNYF